VSRIFPFLSGLLFTVGLVVSGMTEPAKIVGFLDFFGAWDPSMMMVTFGAVAVYMPVHRWVMRLRAPLFAPGFSLPTRQAVDPGLVIGAALFGVGWGLAGYCPGPGVASLGSASATVIVFVVAMLAGMAGFAVFERASRTSPQ
jgi:uncharacterized membrane protein YedE/YeeE